MRKLQINYVNIRKFSVRFLEIVSKFMIKDYNKNSENF